MAKKIDAVHSEIYSAFLNGGRRQNAAVASQVAHERMYLRVLTELAANRFEWTGLPDSVNKRFLEWNLVHTALAVFYWDADLDKHLAVKGSGAGHTNFVDDPVSFTVIGPGIGAGHAKTLSAVPGRDADGNRSEIECVPIWANYSRTPDWDIIRLYSSKMAKLDRTIEITMDNMRKTKVVAAPQDQVLSYQNILKNMADGQDVIFGTNAMQDVGSNIQVLDLGVGDLTLPNLQIAKSKLWTECMGMLGINGANQDKKERLVAAEVGANDEQVQASRNVALNARQFACEQINQLWDLNVSVDFKTPPPVPGSEADSPSDTASSDESSTAKDETKEAA